MSLCLAILNPLTDLSGPEFLLFYALLVAAAVVFARWRLAALDPTHVLPVPEVPMEVDPLAIGYLRGGAKEVAQLVVLDLIARDYLVRTKGGKRSGSVISRAAAHPSPELLTAVPRFVFDWMGTERDGADVALELPKQLARFPTVTKLRERLEQQQLLTSQAQRQEAPGAVFVPIVLLVSISLWRVMIALSRHRYNLLYLLIMTVGAAIFLAKLGVLPHATALGRAYLERLNVAYSRLRPRMKSLANGPAHDELMLAVSVFGIGALAGTAYGYYPEMYRRAQPVPDTSGGGDSGSSCSSGSSSCSSGSSCGSSCGGGCGGGCGGCGS